MEDFDLVWYLLYNRMKNGRYIPTTISNVPIASITDAAAKPLRELIIDIDPVQDLHGYSNPWPAGGGKNKFDKSSATADSYISSNGSVNGTTGWTVSDYIPASEDTAYTLSGSGAVGSAAYTGFYDANKSNISTVVNTQTTFTTPSGTAYIRISLISASINTTQLELGSSATSYQPYSNISPISGWSEVNLWRTGINIWDEQWEVGSIDNTTGLPVANNTVIRSKNFIPVLPNTRYYMTVTAGYRFAYDADKNFIRVFDLNNGPTPANCHFIKFRLPSTYGTTYNHDISINYPATDHDYHAYDGDTYHITIPTPPGTVYGGYIQVGADGSAELVVDRALRTFTGQEQGWEKFGNNNPNGTYFGLPGTTSYAAFADDPEAICSINKRSASAALLTGDGFYWTSGGWRILYGAAGGTESLDNFKAYLQQMYAAGTPVTVCAKLATPIEIQLDQTTIQLLKGSNNIWATTGDINTLVYLKDPKLS